MVSCMVLCHLNQMFWKNIVILRTLVSIRFFLGIVAVMEIEKKSKQNSKREHKFDQAQASYWAGKSIAEIAQAAEVSISTIRRWKEEGQWEQKERTDLSCPRLLSKNLKNMVQHKAEKILENGELQVKELEELLKLFTLLDRLSDQAGDFRTAVVAVMDRFGDFMRRQDLNEAERLLMAGLIKDFFQEVE
jgi:transposase